MFSFHRFRFTPLFFASALDLCKQLNAQQIELHESSLIEVCCVLIPELDSTRLPAAAHPAAEYFPDKRNQHGTSLEFTTACLDQTTLLFCCVVGGSVMLEGEWWSALLLRAQQASQRHGHQRVSPYLDAIHQWAHL